MKNRNSLIIRLFSFSMSLCFYTPVFASFFSSVHSLNKSQITILFACFSLSSFLFEIPTGLLADKLGVKKSLVFGTALVFSSTLLFVVGDSIILLYLGEILLGVSNTFFTGPFEVLTYQYCKEDASVTYTKFMSQSYILQYMALFISFLACSFLTLNIDVSAPFIATLVANLVTIILACMLPNYHGSQLENIWAILKESVSAIYEYKGLRNMCLINALYSMLLVCGYQLIQPYLYETAIPSSRNGFLYLTAALFGCIGSFVFGKMDFFHKKNKRPLHLCIMITIVCFFSLSFMSTPWIIVFVFCCYRLIWGIATPVLVFNVNEVINGDDYRDTIFSMISLVSNLSGAALLFLFGCINTSETINYTIMGFLSLVLFVASHFG